MPTETWMELQLIVNVALLLLIVLLFVMLRRLWKITKALLQLIKRLHNAD